MHVKCLEQDLAHGKHSIGDITITINNKNNSIFPK